MFRITCAAVALSLISHVAAADQKELVITWSGTQKPTLVYNYTAGQPIPSVPVSVVTPIPAQTGVPTPVPAPISFFDADYLSQFTFFQSQDDTIGPDTKFDTCDLVFSADQSIDATATTCTGATITSNSSETVNVVAFGVPMSKTAGQPPAGFDQHLTSPEPSREVIFKNKTGYDSICLNFESQFNSSQCTGAGDVVVTDSYTHSVPAAGDVSSAAFVTGYSSDGTWTYSGHSDSKVGVYATAMEWTMFPTAPVGKNVPAGMTDHTVGMTNIDLSAVNGYNMAIVMAVNSPAICSTAGRNSDGSVQPASYDKWSGDLSQLPVRSAPKASTALFDACPKPATADQSIMSGGAFIGCMSPCQFAEKDGLTDVDVICCSGDFADSAKCTAATFDWPSASSKITHGDLAYVKNLAEPVTKNVYRWQFDDYVGDFSCEPSASFTFEIYALSE